MQQDYLSDGLDNVSNKYFVKGVRRLYQCAKLSNVNPTLSKFGALFDVFFSPEVMIQ